MSKIINIIDKKKLQSSTTFCPLPYIGLYYDMTDFISPCCIINTDHVEKVDAQKNFLENYNNNLMRDIRKSLSSNQQHPACSHCWNAENVGMISLRQTWLNHIDDNFFNDIEIDENFYISDVNINYVDIRFNNKCNLKCRTCNPRFSNSWYKDYKLVIDEEYSEPKNIKISYDVKKLKEVLRSANVFYFAGGEPLITDEHYEILELIKDRAKDIHLNYNTNFSSLKYKNFKVTDYWKFFNRVVVAASLDGNYKRGEYIRKNLKWSDVIKNRKILLEECPHVDFRISCTLSIMNAYNIVELHKEWLELGYIGINDFNVNLLFGPSAFCIKNLPDSHKNKLTDLYYRHIEWLDENKANIDIKNMFQSAINLLKQTPDNDWKYDWSLKVEKLDLIRKEDFFKVFPEYIDLKEINSN